MKNGFGLLVCALSLLTFASTAQSDNGDASGTFTFDLGTATGTVNFAGHLAHKNDPATGQISLHATIDVSPETCEQVNLGTEENPILADLCEHGNAQPTTVALDLLIDRMVISNNRAAMSGVIVDESSPFRDQHVILAVENASGNDGFTWGVYKRKFVNTNAKDYEFCDRGYRPPDDCGELNICPIPPTGCFVVEGPPPPDDPGAGMTYVASDYDLCPYPPPTDTDNFLPAGDPHNYTCYTGAPDPNPVSAGIPVDALHTLTNADSFPLFTYPMTPIPHGGGNKLTVKDNG